MYRRITFVTAMIILLGLLAVGNHPAAVGADGPVDPASLPGGVTVTDTDPGAGEQWGRAGGRDITYAVNNLAGFSALSWGIVNGTTPAAAFDNNIDGLDFGAGSRPGEFMSYNPGGSNPAGGIAQWTGEAQIELVVPSVTRTVVPTRFTLTVTDAVAQPVPLAFVASEVDPGINVLTDTNGTFTANLFFEAQAPGSTVWEPILDMFDRLDTGIGADGFAHTTVNTGFYFVAAGGGGLSLEDHDANISDQVGAVKDDTAFLRIDAINRLIQLATDLTMLKNQVNQLPTDIQIPNDIATRNDVSAVAEQLTETLLVLFGIFPCPPEAGPLCDSATFITDLATQASVDAKADALEVRLDDHASQTTNINDILSALVANVVELKRVHVQVIELKANERYLLGVTEGGIPVNSSEVTLIRVLAGSREVGIPFQDITTTNVSITPATGVAGVLEMTIAGESPDAVDSDTVFQIELVHTDANGAQHFGTALLNFDD